MVDPRKVALSGLSSPVDPIGVATEGFIEGGPRVPLVVDIAATSSCAALLTALPVVQLVVTVAATTAMSAPLTTSSYVQLTVSVSASSSMSAQLSAPQPQPARRRSAGGGGALPDEQQIRKEKEELRVVIEGEIAKEKKKLEIKKELEHLDEVRAQIQAETAKESERLREVLAAAAKAAVAYTAVRTALWFVA